MAITREELLVPGAKFVVRDLRGGHGFTVGEVVTLNRDDGSTAPNFRSTTRTDETWYVMLDSLDVVPTTFKVGEKFVLISDAAPRSLPYRAMAGETVTVDNANLDPDGDVVVRRENGYLSWVRPENLKPALKVGDKVRPVGREAFVGHVYRDYRFDGSVATVDRMSGGAIHVVWEDGRGSHFFAPHAQTNLVIVESAKTPDPKPVFKVGDKVRVTAPGKWGGNVVGDEAVVEDPEDDDGDVYIRRPGGRGGFVEARCIELVTTETVAARAFRLGDRVRVTTHTSTWGNAHGAVGTVREEPDWAGDVWVRWDDLEGERYEHATRLELVVEEAAPPSEPKVGDLIVVTAEHNGWWVRPGDVMRVLPPYGMAKGPETNCFWTEKVSGPSDNRVGHNCLVRKDCCEPYRPAAPATFAPPPTEPTRPTIPEKFEAWLVEQLMGADAAPDDFDDGFNEALRQVAEELGYDLKEIPKSVTLTRRTVA